jgi:hypothetical protein
MCKPGTQRYISNITFSKWPLQWLILALFFLIVFYPIAVILRSCQNLAPSIVTPTQHFLDGSPLNQAPLDKFLASTGNLLPGHVQSRRIIPSTRSYSHLARDAKEHCLYKLPGTANTFAKFLATCRSHSHNLRCKGCELPLGLFDDHIESGVENGAQVNCPSLQPRRMIPQTQSFSHLVGDARKRCLYTRSAEQTPLRFFCGGCPCSCCHKVCEHDLLDGGKDLDHVEQNGDHCCLRNGRSIATDLDAKENGSETSEDSHSQDTSDFTMNCRWRPRERPCRAGASGSPENRALGYEESRFEQVNTDNPYAEQESGRVTERQELLDGEILVDRLSAGKTASVVQHRLCSFVEWSRRNGMNGEIDYKAGEDDPGELILHMAQGSSVEHYIPKRLSAQKRDNPEVAYTPPSFPRNLLPARSAVYCRDFSGKARAQCNADVESRTELFITLLILFSLVVFCLFLVTVLGYLRRRKARRRFAKRTSFGTVSEQRSGALTPIAKSSMAPVQDTRCAGKTQGRGNSACDQSHSLDRVKAGWMLWIRQKRTMMVG